jgi:hypothetical protein
MVGVISFGGCRVASAPEDVRSVKWELAIIAATVLAVAAVSRRLTSTSVTPAMVFVVLGVLVGPLVIDEVTAAPTGEGVKTLAEATLAVVLFADASLDQASRAQARVCGPTPSARARTTTDDRHGCAPRGGDLRSAQSD